MNPIFQGLFPVVPKKSGILPKSCDFPSILKILREKLPFLVNRCLYYIWIKIQKYSVPISVVLSPFFC